MNFRDEVEEVGGENNNPPLKALSLEAYMRTLQTKKDAEVLSRLRPGMYIVATVRTDIGLYNRRLKPWPLTEDMVALAGKRTMFLTSWTQDGNKKILILRGFGFLWKPFQLYDYGDLNVQESEEKHYIS